MKEKVDKRLSERQSHSSMKTLFVFAGNRSKLDTKNLIKK